MIVDGDIDSRHGWKKGWLLFVDGLEHLVELKSRQQHHFCAVAYRKIHDHRHRKNMKQRQYTQHDLFAWPGLREYAGALLHICREVGMGQHGAFRQAGRAAGVLQHGDVLKLVSSR